MSVFPKTTQLHQTWNLTTRPSKLNLSTRPTEPQKHIIISPTRPLKLLKALKSPPSERERTLKKHHHPQNETKFWTFAISSKDKQKANKTQSKEKKTKARSESKNQQQQDDDQPSSACSVHHHHLHHHHHYDHHLLPGSSCPRPLGSKRKWPLDTRHK